MKITGKPDLASATLSSRALNPFLDSDLTHKPSSRKSPRRRTRNAGVSGAGVRLKRDGAPGGRRSRPETPLLRWKFDDRKKDGDVKDERSVPEIGRRSGRRATRGGEVLLSARKLAAGLWRLQLPEDAAGGGERHCASNGLLGFQSGVYHAGVQSHGLHKSEAYGSVAKDLIQNPHSFSSSRKGFLNKIEPSLHFSNSAMEGVTKWEPFCSRTSDEVLRVYGHLKVVDQQISAVSVISALKMELEQSRARVDELETEQRSSKKKLEHFLRKVSEERATWRSREHEKVRAIIDDIKADLHRERKSRQRMEIINSKLVNELADTKLAAKRFMQEYEKERKDRELIEEVCNELAKEVGEDKADAEALKRESMKLREEVDDERKMLQMAEVWREERVQMKLVDAKVTLEEKYSQMNTIVAELESFLSSRLATPDAAEMRKAEFLRQAAASVNIDNLKEFTYDPPNPDDIFSVIEDVTFGERNDREIEPCVAYSPASHASKIHTVSPEVNVFDKGSIQRHSKAYNDQNGDVEEDESGWETVSHAEDQVSSYSSNGSDASVNNICQAMLESGIDWEKDAGEETPITEISEVCLGPTMQVKQVSSISQPCRSYSSYTENYKIIPVEGIHGRLSNGRLSNGAMNSPDRGSANGGYSPMDMVGQLSSPLSGYTHITRGKGCIEWPRGMQKNSLKSRLLEARMESQKVQLRQVLKQKI